MTEIRRRIREGYYDRPEVRRGMGRILLRRLARENARKKRECPESA